MSFSFFFGLLFLSALRCFPRADAAVDFLITFFAAVVADLTAVLPARFLAALTGGGTARLAALVRTRLGLALGLALEAAPAAGTTSVWTRVNGAGSNVDFAGVAPVSPG